MGRSPLVNALPKFSATLSEDDLTEYVANQMDTLFKDGASVRPGLKRFVAAALERMEYCVMRSSFKGFHTDKDGPRYNHLHTDMHAIFLYYLSNSLYRMSGPTPLAEKSYALNKALHGLDAFYEVELPDVFAVVHPVGTVLGRATYGDYFCAYQNVSVGADLDGNHPVFGEGVVLYGGSRIVGKVIVGNNCFVSAGTSVVTSRHGPKVAFPENRTVFGPKPDEHTRLTQRNVIKDIFRPIV